jgi:hypothetical protein
MDDPIFRGLAWCWAATVYDQWEGPGDPDNVPAGLAGRDIRAVFRSSIGEEFEIPAAVPDPASGHFLVRLPPERTSSMEGPVWTLRLDWTEPDCGRVVMVVPRRVEVRDA